ncbi:hypothetical protein N7537_011848 [Penicillium hordei]|uniref:Zn(2)-C6 fungal-type domain-containing protein n=1 Tax=Penicillium hordei TaxID=40994 RepID=A0AAD6GUG8_9EURO|nr:uncharacterized protein N7537_011848 [Penicillium hordei]KAJ5589170.1 hypothetical protein N7537_011848 [Penicillium hordei]
MLHLWAKLCEEVRAARSGHLASWLDILNRHVLQHNVPPDGAKRTPLACQTCRRRKTKCDSNYPCSICVNSGEACVREPSSTQNFTPASRSTHKGSLWEENRSIELAEEVDYGGTGTPTIPSVEDTSPMRLDWNTPMDRSASNHVSNTRPTLRNMGPDQDPLRPLTDPLMGMISGIHTAISTPNRTPPLYFSEPPDIMNFPFDAPVGQPSETRDRFVIDEPCEIHMSHLSTFTPSRRFSNTDASMLGMTSHETFTPASSSSGSLQLHEAITSQAQFVTAQIKSIGFENFHQSWPFLHVPTFAPEKQTKLLTSAVVNLSMWMQNANRHHLVPYGINQELTNALMPKITIETLTEKQSADITLPTLQALVVTLTYAILGDAQAPACTLNWAAQWTDIAIFTFRRLGVLDDRWHPEEHLQSADERWVQTEEMKRLVYAVLRIDTYLCIILDRPPTMRYQEIGPPLPVSDNLWRAETRADRTSLHWYEPAGRTKSTFSTLVRDGLESRGFMTGYLRMPHLTLEDNHFSLCAFLSEIWCVSKEAHEEHHRNYRSPELNRTADRAKLWKGYLQDWRVHIENTNKLEDTFFGGCISDYNHFLGLDLTLYHLLSLKLYANMRLLEHSKCCSGCQEANIENVISVWARSPDGRQAVYHAAQLKRVYERESNIYRLNDQRLCNVLGPAGLLNSAIVLCTYSAKASGVHTPGGDSVMPAPADAIELSQSNLVGTLEFDNWISQGGPATVDGVALHHFSVPRFSSWHRDRLETCPVYSSRLSIVPRCGTDYSVLATVTSQGVGMWSKIKKKWTGSDSNAGLFACKANTLPTELRAQLIRV